MQRNHQSLQQTLNQGHVSVEDDIALSVQHDVGPQRPVQHSNDDKGDTTPVEHTGNLTIVGGGTNEVTYQSLTQGTATEESIYTSLV